MPLCEMTGGAEPQSSQPHSLATDATEEVKEMRKLIVAVLAAAALALAPLAPLAHADTCCSTDSWDGSTHCSSC